MTEEEDASCCFKGMSLLKENIALPDIAGNEAVIAGIGMNAAAKRGRAIEKSLADKMMAKVAADCNDRILPFFLFFVTRVLMPFVSGTFIVFSIHAVVNVRIFRVNSR